MSEVLAFARSYARQSVGFCRPPSGDGSYSGHGMSGSLVAVGTDRRLCYIDRKPRRELVPWSISPSGTPDPVAFNRKDLPCPNFIWSR